MQRGFRRSLALLALGLIPVWAGADPVALSGCASCNGASYTLLYAGNPQPDADPLSETWRITLRIDTAGVAAVVPSAVAIDGAALKVGSSVAAAHLVAAPGGLVPWHLLPGGISAAGCNGQGSGFECADWTGSGVGYALGGVLDFVFDITLPNGALFDGTNEASIKARFVKANGSKAGAVMSESITLQLDSPPPTAPPSGDGVPPNDAPPTAVPEPGTLALVALAVVAGARRRRSA